MFSAACGTSEAFAGNADARQLNGLGENRFMRRFRFGIILALISLVSLAAQNTPGNPVPGASTGAAVRILAPQSGAKLAQDFVSVEYELINPGSVPATPTFSVQLDNQEAVKTSDTKKEFSGLAPGIHNVSVWVVDANGTPLAGSSATVQFILLNPTAQPGPGQKGAWMAGQPIAAIESSALPAASSPLPLLSVIGFGVLFGGLISSMKTR